MAAIFNIVECKTMNNQEFTTVLNLSAIHHLEADVARDDFQRRFAMQMKLREI